VDVELLQAIRTQMKPLKLQVKHIPDDAVLTLIRSLANTSRIYRTRTGFETFTTKSASWYDIQRLWDNVPPKLMLAKLRNMERRGLIDGCPCGCIGSFTVIEKEVEDKSKVV
jgi:hypothetical protein